MNGTITRVLSLAGAAWEYLRAVIGDNAYERYLEVSAKRGERPLSAGEFYVDSAKRRYSSVSRCC